MAEGSVGLDGPSVTTGKRVQERRFWADLIDVVVLPAVLGAGFSAMFDIPVGVFGLGGLLTMPLLVASEALRQRTPGKGLLDLQVELVAGDSVGWRSALLRRVWMAMYALHLIPGFSTEIAELVVFAAMASVVVSMHRHPEARGWHDRLAGTRVVRASRPRPRTSTVALWTIGCVALLVAGWWFSSPSTTSSSFRAFEQAEQLRCDVAHDGWLYAQQRRTVVLEPGDSFSGRFGPHDVTLRFVTAASEHGNPGLEIDQASRSFGITTGQSRGNDTGMTDVTTGPGIGELTIECDAR